MSPNCSSKLGWGASANSASGRRRAKNKVVNHVLLHSRECENITGGWEIRGHISKPLEPLLRSDSSLAILENTPIEEFNSQYEGKTRQIEVLEVWFDK